MSKELINYIDGLNAGSDELADCVKQIYGNVIDDSRGFNVHSVKHYEDQILGKIDTLQGYSVQLKTQKYFTTKQRDWAHSEVARNEKLIETYQTILGLYKKAYDETISY